MPCVKTPKATTDLHFSTTEDAAKRLFVLGFFFMSRRRRTFCIRVPRSSRQYRAVDTRLRDTLIEIFHIGSCGARPSEKKTIKYQSLLACAKREKESSYSYRSVYKQEKTEPVPHRIGGYKFELSNQIFTIDLKVISPSSPPWNVIWDRKMR